MCLTTNDPTLKVAEQDITVYKRVNRYKVQNNNRTLWEKILGKNKIITVVEAESHSFQYHIDEKCPTVELSPFRTFGDDDEFEVEAGYHSYVDMNGCNSVFIIPKGTRYIDGWYNDSKSIANRVSETIILKELL